MLLFLQSAKLTPEGRGVGCIWKSRGKSSSIFTAALHCLTLNQSSNYFSQIMQNLGCTLKELIQDPAACYARNTKKAFSLMVSTAKSCSALMFETFEGPLSSYTWERSLLCGTTSHHENVPSSERLATHEAFSPVSQGSLQIGTVEASTKVQSSV